MTKKEYEIIRQKVMENRKKEKKISLTEKPNEVFETVDALMSRLSNTLK